MSILIYWKKKSKPICSSSVLHFPKKPFHYYIIKHACVRHSENTTTVLYNLLVMSGITDEAM